MTLSDRVSAPLFTKEKVDRHCPFDEAQLRVATQAGFYICPCCYEYFPIPKARGL